MDEKQKAEIEKSKFDLALHEKRENLELERDRKKWNNRRRMAWSALLWLILMTVYIFHIMDIKRIEALSGMLEWIYLLFSSIVLGYLGIATYSEISQSRSKK